MINLKRFLITYSVEDRLVTTDIHANNMWEALQKFDALDVSVDETISIFRAPRDLKLISDDRPRRNVRNRISQQNKTNGNTSNKREREANGHPRKDGDQRRL